MKPPVRVTITGAAGHIGYQLAFRIASGQMLGADQPISLRLLELPKSLEALVGIKMELEDCAYPTLNDVFVTSSVSESFYSCDYAILVGALPRMKGMDRKDLLEANARIFEAQGKAINESASRDVKVIVVGNPANTNALIASANAPSIPITNFTAMTRLDHNRAVSALASKLDCPVDDISRVTIWGNHSDTQFPDITDTVVHGRPAVEMLEEQEETDWIEKNFIPRVQTRGGEIIKARGASSAASAASAVIDHMRDWIGETGNEWTSMAVASDGSYGIEEGVFYSFPVKCGNGEYEIIRDLNINDIHRAVRMSTTNEELRKEREAVEELI